MTYLRPGRRRTVLLAGASLGVLLPMLSGTAGAAVPRSSSRGKTITYLYFTNGPDLAATKTLISKFEKQTGDTVTLELVPYTSLNEILQARVSAGDPPAVVQTTTPSTFGSDLVNLGKTLGSSWVKSLSPGLLGEAVYKGQVVALPNQLTVAGPFVNVAMFKKAGVAVPTKWTWSQMVADAKKVQAANGTPFAIAMDHSGSRTANVFCQFGAYLYGSNGKSQMNKTAAVSAMTYLSGLFKNNTLSSAAWIAAGTAYQAGDTEWLAKEAPVLLSGSWEVAAFVKSTPFPWAAVADPTDAVGGAMSGGNYMEAFKKSNDPQLAAQFIKFMSEPANQALMSVASDTIPSAKALAKPGAVKYPGAAASAMDTFNAGAVAMPAGCNLSEANPGFTAASTALMGELTDVIAGQTTPAAAVSSVLATAKQNNNV